MWSIYRVKQLFFSWYDVLESIYEHDKIPGFKHLALAMIVIQDKNNKPCPLPQISSTTPFPSSSQNERVTSKLKEKINIIFTSIVVLCVYRWKWHYGLPLYVYICQKPIQRITNQSFQQTCA